MSVAYQFKDSKTVDNVAKALIFVSKFSRKHALIEFGDQSVDIVWNDLSYHVRAQFTSFDMFGKNRRAMRGTAIYIEANPATLGRILKSGHTQDRQVAIYYSYKENKIRIVVNYNDGAKRKITHSIPCSQGSYAEFKNRMEINSAKTKYDTKCYIDKIGTFKHMIESFVKLDAPRVYIWSKRGGDLSLHVKTQGSNVVVSLSDLENDQSCLEEGIGGEEGRSEAGVNIDTKKLAVFLSNLSSNKDNVSRMCFEIKHSQMLRVSFESEVPNSGEKFYESLVLTHNLNPN